MKNASDLSSTSFSSMSPEKQTDDTHRDGQLGINTAMFNVIDSHMRSFLLLARIELNLYPPRKAITSLQHLLKAYHFKTEAGKVSATYTEILAALGHAQCIAGQYSTAMITLQAALQTGYFLTKAGQDTEFYARTLIELGKAQSLTGQYPTAMITLRAALQTSYLQNKTAECSELRLHTLIERECAKLAAYAQDDAIAATSGTTVSPTIPTFGSRTSPAFLSPSSASLIKTEALVGQAIVSTSHQP